MNITDIFIKRPVLATVISLLILIFGFRSIHDLPLRQFPKMENSVITVTTAYPGANAKLVQGFITTPLEKSIAGSEGIDYLTATSTEGLSTIQAHIDLNYDPDKAFTNIMSKVAEARNQLPGNAEQPVIQKDTGSQIALMYISFSSQVMSPEQITDYISRVVQPKLETISGVAGAQILGDKTFAMRIWLNPKRMAALNVTPSDVATILKTKNFIAAVGKTKGEYIAYNLSANTDLHTADDFKQMIIKNVNGSLVRLGDVADVSLGAQMYDASVTFNGQQAIFIAVTATPKANPLTVISDVRQEIPNMAKDFPPGLESKIVYDATDYIRASIHEVIRTIIEATAIVVVVIFLFLGSLRSVLIPIVTIPLSLIGVTTFMLALGYSLNLLTLLAMVLAIGLVVDDAIVVVENIYRHIEEGLSPMAAALQGAKEIATPVIAMTITLAAVYAPIGFMGGVTGALFKEFAFTLASAVIISGIIALTLSPMMCSKLLSATIMQNRFVHQIDIFFDKLKNRYQTTLHNSLSYRPVTLVFALTVLVSCAFLYMLTKKELAPDEDQSVLFMSATGPEYANIDYIEKYTQEFNGIFRSIPAVQDYFIVNGMGAVNNVIAGAILKPWGQRTLSQAQANDILQSKITQVTGLNTVVFPLPSLPVGGDGLPIQFIITTTGSYEQLNQLAEQVLQDAQRSGMFLFVDKSLKFSKPEFELNIDRNKAAQLGVDISDIGLALATSLSGGNTNYFSMEGRSYQVIPQLGRSYRETVDQIKQIYVRTSSGTTIPLGTFTTIIPSVQPNSLTQFNQLNSATIQGLPMIGKTMGEVINWFQTEAASALPKGVSYDFAGQSRQYIQEGNALLYTFFFAIIVIFLVLAAQFESFRDPLIILVSVPMSICGALIPLNLGLASINIYTQVGLITLIGLISKHGILMVDFANKLQIQEGLKPRQAIEKSAGIRLRPILMTTAAMVLGVLPLLMASGAGAASRFGIGLVIASGLTIGTLFTLFVLPMIYTFIAKHHTKAEL